MKMPKRFGPEWWALYSAAFVHQFEDPIHYGNFDESAKHRSMYAERAAREADEGLSGFREAVEGEGITLPRVRRKRRAR